MTISKKDLKKLFREVLDEKGKEKTVETEKLTAEPLKIKEEEEISDEDIERAVKEIEEKEQFECPVCGYKSDKRFSECPVCKTELEF